MLSTVGLVLPVDWIRDRRGVPTAHREGLVARPTMRNEVLQTALFSVETNGGSAWCP